MHASDLKGELFYSLMGLCIYDGDRAADFRRAPYPVAVFFKLSMARPCVDEQDTASVQDVEQVEPIDGIGEHALEEACVLLNVTPETPKDEVNRIYTAMARVWLRDKATSEADRKPWEAKMKQLNAAGDSMLGW